MKDYQQDKYENFFLTLKASREVWARFGDFTAEAIAAPGIDLLLSNQRPALLAAMQAFRQGLVMRQGSGGASQGSTDTEQTAFEQFKKFIEATHARVLHGHFYDHPDQESLLYPDRLSGLTQAPVGRRLTRLEAYTKALEAAEAPAVKAQGPPARALFAAYAQASQQKTRARSVLQNAIKDLGPEGRALAEALWAVHTTALYLHRAEPALARRYFDFAGLPNRVNRKSAKADS